MKPFFRIYGLSLGVAVAILYLSLTTGDGMPRVPLFVNADKLVHFAMYAGLAGVLTLSMRIDGRGLLLTAFWAVVMASAYGGILELIQPYFPPRTCDWEDFLADAVGAISGFVAADCLWLSRARYK